MVNIDVNFGGLKDRIFFVKKFYLFNIKMLIKYVCI